MTNISAARDRRNLRRWGSLLFIIVMLGFFMLCALLTYRPAAASEALDISIQSNRMADYSVGELLSTPLPAINLGIISDVIKDRESTDFPARLETIQVILKTPVSTVTPSPTSSPTLFGAPTQDFTPTLPANTPLPTATLGGPAQTNTRTPINTSINTPANSPTSIIVTGTIVDTSTPESTKKTPTQKPTDKPTNTDVFTATPVNTSTRTPVSTSTHTRTATPIPSRTPTWTPTRTPTKTPIPTIGAVCSPPDKKMGFVASITPEDDAENAPRNTDVYIKFNQAMFEADLIRNIKISGTDVDYVMSYNPQTNVLKIDFIDPLKRGSTVKIAVKRNVKNSCGQRQGKDIKFEFQVSKTRL